MTTQLFTPITISAHINAPLDTVWKLYTEPEHITHWNNASSDWHTPRAENNLSIGGTFNYRMEARDGSVGFDFGGTYTHIQQYHRISYVMADGRNVTIIFERTEQYTQVTITFDAEHTNPLEMQRDGWQAILDNFKTYAETWAAQHNA